MYVPPFFWGARLFPQSRHKLKAPRAAVCASNGLLLRTEFACREQRYLYRFLREVLELLHTEIRKT
jgi:hypothetical protein